MRAGVGFGRAASATVTGSVTRTAEVFYRNGAWGGAGTTTWEAGGNATAGQWSGHVRGGLQADVAVSIYDLAGPMIGVETGLRANATPDTLDLASGQWALLGQGRADIGGKVSLFGLKDLALTIPIVQADWPITQGTWGTPTTAPPSSPPPTSPPTSPPPPPDGIVVARSSGPAGFSTQVRGPACPAPPPGMSVIWFVVYPEPFGSSILGYSLGSSTQQSFWGLSTFTSNEDFELPVGTWRYLVQCRNVVDPNDMTEARLAPVTASWGVDLTVTGPQLRVGADVSAASPCQVVRITDGGCCGPWDWGEVTVGVIPSDPQIQARPPISPTGRWGPVDITLPTTPLDPRFSVKVRCKAADRSSGIQYRTLVIPSSQ